MIKSIYVLAFALIFAGNAKSQTCQGFHLGGKCGIPDTEDFKRFGQSRSKLVDSKKTFSYKAVFFGGYDYKIGLCTERDYGPIQFRIINADDNSVFYDNSNDDYIETVGFTVEKTKNVMIEITLLATKKEFKDFTDSRACAGISIFWRKVPKTGF